MSIQPQITLRSRKLGVLIRDARLAGHLTLPQCAQMTGVTIAFLRSWEEGRRSPSLPEVELLAYGLNLPLKHFWSKEARSDDASPTDHINKPAYINIRQRLVGALLRQEREKAGISITALGEQAGMPVSRLRAYELGDRPIPLPELEGLITLVGGEVDMLFDHTGPIGLWMTEQQAIQDFLQLPGELQEFIRKPVNRPYLELAKKLSEYSTEKLRTIAEDLLEITF
jgi:transcriptional regulator with XRE-family HTH domain